MALGPSCDGTYIPVDIRDEPQPGERLETSGTVHLPGHVPLYFTTGISADGRTLSGTLTDPALANRDLRCVLQTYGYGKEPVLGEPPRFDSLARRGSRASSRPRLRRRRLRR